MHRHHKNEPGPLNRLHPSLYRKQSLHLDIDLVRLLHVRLRRLRLRLRLLLLLTVKSVEDNSMSMKTFVMYVPEARTVVVPKLSYTTNSSVQHKWTHVTITVKDRTLYDTLNIFPDASDDDLRRAYKRAALLHHPDKAKSNPLAHEKFIAVKDAFDILSDPVKSELYKKYGLDLGQRNTNAKYNDSTYGSSSSTEASSTVDPDSFRCWGCSCNFYSLATMFSHLELGHCSYISKASFKNVIADLNGPWRGRTMDVKCSNCDRDFRKLSSLLQHATDNRKCTPFVWETGRYGIYGLLKQIRVRLNLPRQMLNGIWI